MGVLWSKIERVLSKEIQGPLKSWDHIYTWRPDNSKFHGIYDGDNEKVIHINPRHARQENNNPCDVVSSSMDEFLDGGELYRFEYGVNLALFLAKPQAGATCTLKSDDIPEFVKYRASVLLQEGFRVDHRFKNNSEDFAVYCKTGLLSVRVSRSDQAASLLGCAVFIIIFPLFAISSFLPASLTTNVISWVAAGVVVYCTCRNAFDMKLHLYGYRHEIFANVEVEEPGFLIRSMAWCLHLVCSWFFPVLEVASDIFIFVKNSKILTFGAGCCLAISRWINYCMVITYTLAGAIPTPITKIVAVAWEMFTIYNTVVVAWEIFAIYNTVQDQVRGENYLKTRELNSYLKLGSESHVCAKIAGVLWSMIQKVLSKKIDKKQLKHWDHIYTWRPDNSKSHGIYDKENEKVIHVTPRHASQENSQPCGVVSSSINKFLDGGKLCLFEYGVNPALFLAKPQGGATCTLKCDDKPEFVKKRACFFLDNGFPVPDLHKNNSEVFALYCKTGLLSNRVIRSEPAASLLTCAIFFLRLSRFTPASLTGWAATGVVVYCIYTLACDIGARPDVMNKVAVRKLADVEVKELGFLHTQMDWILLVLIIWVYLVCAVPECIMLFCGAIFQGNFKFRSWLLFNKISVDQLQTGDHIYKWKGYAYTHHGIYAGKGEVIHVVRDSGRPLLFSRSPFIASNDRVESIKIDDFASAGELYRYDYGVKLGYFIAKIRGGSCTLASSDRPRDKYVLHRANFLLQYNPKKRKRSKLIRKGGFGTYDLLDNNCEDFAIYCKTGLIVTDIGIFRARSGQIACLFAALCGFLIDYANPSLHSNLICVALFLFCIYSAFKMIADTKFRSYTHEIPVEKLADPEKLAEKLADFESDYFNSKLVILFLLLKLVLASAIFLWTWWCPVSLYSGMGRDWGIGCGNEQLKGITMGIMLSLMLV